MINDLITWVGWWPVSDAARDPDYPHLARRLRWEELNAWGAPVTHTLYVARLAQLERLRREATDA